MITTVIPAAGASQRFVDAGWTIPKPLLRLSWRGKEDYMINHVIDSLPVTLKPPIIGLPGSVTAPFLNAQVCQIFHTQGQADTLLQLVQSLQGSVIVLNCDVVFSTRVLEHLAGRLTAASTSHRPPYTVVSVVMQTSNPSWSYVNSFPHPTAYVEKIPISPWGMAGAWGFQSASMLANALTMAKITHPTTECYLSHALCYMPGAHVAIAIDGTDFTDWNTPEAVAASGATIRG